MASACAGARARPHRPRLRRRRRAEPRSALAASARSALRACRQRAPGGAVARHGVPPQERAALHVLNRRGQRARPPAPGRGPLGPLGRTGVAPFFQIEHGAPQRSLRPARGAWCRGGALEHRREAGTGLLVPALALVHDGQVDGVGGDAVGILQRLRHTQGLAVMQRGAVQVSAAQVGLGPAVGFHGGRRLRGVGRSGRLRTGGDEGAGQACRNAAHQRCAAAAGMRAPPERDSKLSNGTVRIAAGSM